MAELLDGVWLLKEDRPHAQLYYVHDGLLKIKADFYDYVLAQKVVEFLNGN